MLLETYQKKRQFDNTPEPQGGTRKKSSSSMFVVQQHDATRFHYDFRIEVNGVLVSWAIPKQPVRDPKVKRLAIKTEDHPLEYADFEGVIPEGNYGAGPVMIWDKGTYAVPTTADPKTVQKIVSEEIENGKIKIVLNGEKLKGTFTLVKLDNEKRNEWLFFKIKDRYVQTKTVKQDFSVKTGRTLDQIRNKNGEIPRDPHAFLKRFNIEAAVESSVPKDVHPMLATLIDEPFDNKDWLFEIKLDGYRTIAETGKEVRLHSRKGEIVNEKYPSLVEALQKIPDNMLLDGEIVVLDESGRSSFEMLQKWQKEHKGKLQFQIFDVLHWRGFDLRLVPLHKRKNLLRQILPQTKFVQYLAHIEENGEKFFQEIVKQGFEGIVAKQKNSYYEPAKRSDQWLKIKNIKYTEAIICGYTEPEGSRKHFGSLALGVYDNKKLIYIGNVGTGFDEKELKSLHRKLKKIHRKSQPFDEEIEADRPTQWLRLKYVCQVKYREWTDDQKLRQAVYIGLREDKKPEEIALEEYEDTAELLHKEPLPEDVSEKNRKKIFWPEEGYTKGDVLDYYDQVAEYILPYLKDRPQTLYRTPDGLKKDGFYQKNVAGKVPEWIETIRLRSESAEREIEFLLCQNKQTLMFMINWGCVELHTWNSRIETLDYPDYAVFDLDPFGVSFDSVIAVAKEIHALLDDLEVPHFPKTSGGSGMHIYVPTKAQYTYEQVRQFTKLIQLIIHSKLPKITSFERMPQNRKGKVYLDYLQNARGKNMITPYSLRPKPEASVSTPLGWDEVKEGIRPTDFTLANIIKRLNEKGDLWNGMFELGFDMRDTIAKLQPLIEEMQ